MSAAVPLGSVAVHGCASCHRPLRPDARFCTACGTPVQGDVTVHVVEGAQGRARADARAREPRPSVLHPAFGDATPAGTGRRVAAYAIDAVAVGVVAGGLYAWTGSLLLAALTVLELGIGLLVWEAHTGRTLGNSLLGLRTAREETPYSVGPARGFLRGLVLAAGHAAAGLGQWLVVASTAFDKSGKAQAWHDRVGRAVVVDVRAHERAVEEELDAADRAVQAVRAVPSAAPQGVVPHAAVPPQQAVPPQVALPTGRRAARAAEQAAPAAVQAVPSQPLQPATDAPASTGIRPVVPAVAQPEPAPPSRTTHQEQPAPFLVTLDTGEVMTVTGPGLIGRMPRPAPGERCDHVIVVDDPERSVSRTHARFGMDGGTFWVSDAGSGNGTTLRLPGGRVIPVPADQRVLVPSGSTIQVGDRGVRIDAPGAARG